MKFLCILCVLYSSVLSAAALDREAFTFTKYDLDASVEPAQQRLGVRGKITLRNDSTSPQKNAALQISSTLSWHSVNVEGKPVQFVTQPYTSDIDHTGSLSEAIVTLPQEIAPRSSVELEIGYEGVIALDATRLKRIGVPEASAKHDDWDQIGKTFSAVRGVGHVAWYPVAMEAASLGDANKVPEALGRWKARELHAEIRVRFTLEGSPTDVGDDLMCNADSAEVMFDHSKKGEKAATECTFAPLETTVPLFIIAKYQYLSGSALDVSYLGDHKSAAQEYQKAADKIVPFVTEWFGEPRQKADVVELADSQADPYEAESMLLAPLGHVGAGPMELTAVHQLTHSALYSARPWIHEGLGHFAQALYREQQGGRKAALDFMETHRAVLVETEKSLAANAKPDQEVDLSLIRTGMEELYRSKAMYVWWMLREMVGDEVLKKVLGDYQPDQDRNPEYFETLLERESKLDLQWFFNDWLYHDRGLPDFRIESVYPQPNSAGGYLVTVTVENLGGAAAQVPVTVHAASGENTVRLQVPGKAKNSVRINVPSLPVEAVVNDGGVPESDITNNSFKVEPPKQ
jgi:hypothetical protein